MSKWDDYFKLMCDSTASNSKCLSRKIGAVLVKDKSIISTGYNGPPRGVDDCSKRMILDPQLFREVEKVIEHEWCQRNRPEEFGRATKEEIWREKLKMCPRQVLGFKSGEGLEWCVAGHAERNALINAARMGISTKGARLYMNCPIPCTPCLIEIINAGVKEIVVTKRTYYDISSPWLMEQSGLELRSYEG